MLLKAPHGSSGVSHGSQEFKVDETGHVEVPDHVAPFLRGHGFTDPAPSSPSPAPAPATAKETEVQEIEQEAAGFVKVSREHLIEMLGQLGSTFEKDLADLSGEDLVGELRRLIAELSGSSSGEGEELPEGNPSATPGDPSGEVGGASAEAAGEGKADEGGETAPEGSGASGKAPSRAKTGRGRG